ncbi:MAG: NifB/NifX family molybdenum-iron cluster-binding protein [Syntrophobacteraceae bacterium]
MLAIPVLRSRVAPVLNWCSTIYLFPVGASAAVEGRELLLPDMSGLERLKILKQEGVRTIVCGALSPDLLMFGEELGLRIIHGIAGDVTEVLHAYRTRTLDDPCYWLPGCHGPRRYRRSQSGLCSRAKNARTGNSQTSNPVQDTMEARGRISGQKSSSTGMPSGPGGTCVCPRCGAEVAHEPGIPCSRVVCSHCDQPMIRG